MPDIVTFDPVQLIIEEINQGLPAVELDVIEIYSEWKDWLLADSSRLGHPPAFSVTGGEVIGGVPIPSFFFLENHWRFRPAAYNHQVTLNGNLFTREGEPVDIPALVGQVNVRQAFTTVQVDLGTASVDPNIATILARVTEVWQRMGLDLTAPMYVAADQIQVGGIDVQISDTPPGKTVQRQ